MSTGLQAILANPAALASLQNTLGPATAQTQSEAELERARAEVEKAIAQATQGASAASGQADQAAQAYGSAAAAPVQQVDPLEALVNRMGSRTASVLSGDPSYAQGGEKRLDEMHADLVRNRVDNLTALRDQWDMKARAAKEMKAFEDEIKFRSKSEQLNKAMEKLLQEQREGAADKRNKDDNATALEVARINAAARGKEAADAANIDYTTPYTTSTGEIVNYLNPYKIPNIKVRQTARDAAQASGAPVLTQKQEDGLHLLEEAFGNIEGIQAAAIGAVDPETGETTGGFLSDGPLDPKRLTNRFEALAQTNPQIAAFPAYRTAAINIIQSLASLGPGLRINQAEINAALKYDIPGVGDTKATAQAKLKNLREMLTHVEASLLNRATAGKGNAPAASGSSEPVHSSDKFRKKK